MLNFCWWCFLIWLWLHLIFIFNRSILSEKTRISFVFVAFRCLNNHWSWRSSVFNYLRWKLLLMISSVQYAFPYFKYCTIPFAFSGFLLTGNSVFILLPILLCTGVLKIALGVFLWCNNARYTSEPLSKHFFNRFFASWTYCSANPFLWVNCQTSLNFLNPSELYCIPLSIKKISEIPWTAN